MADLSLKIKANFDQASQQFNALAESSEEIRAKIEKYALQTLRVYKKRLLTKKQKTSHRAHGEKKYQLFHVKQFCRNRLTQRHEGHRDLGDF